MTCRAPESCKPSLLAQQNHGMWTMVEVLLAASAADGKRHPDCLSCWVPSNYLKVFKLDKERYDNP